MITKYWKHFLFVAVIIGATVAVFPFPQRLFEMYLSVGEVDQAEEQARKVMDTQGQNRRVIEFLAQQAREVGDPEKLIEYYRRWVELDPNNPELYQTLAETYYWFGMPKMAAVTMEKRIRIFNGLPWVNSAMRTETMEKKPVFLKIATMDIIPSSSMMVSKSMNSTAWCSLTTCSDSKTMTPKRAATALLTSSKVKATYTSRNTTIGIRAPSIGDPFSRWLKPHTPIRWLRIIRRQPDPRIPPIGLAGSCMPSPRAYGPRRRFP